MSGFYAAYLGEFKKLMWRKKYIVFIVIGIFICLLWAAIGSLAAGAALRFGGIPLNLLPTPMGVFPFFAQTLIPLLIFMGVSDLLTAETLVMKAVLGRPVARWKLYSGKMLAVITYAAIYLACIYIVSVFLNQLMAGLAGVGGRALGARELIDALFAYALTLLPLAVLTVFAGFIALLGRSASLTMLVLIVVYLSMRILPIAMPIFGELLFTSHIGWHRLWIGARPSASRLIHIMTIVIGYGAVFFTAGSLIFDRKEY